MSGNERRNRKVFRWCWNDCRVDALTMYSGSEFQMEEAAAGKARLPTVESLTDGTMRRLVATERRVRRPGTSATCVSGPRYRGSEIWNTCMGKPNMGLNFTSYLRITWYRACATQILPQNLGILGLWYTLRTGKLHNTQRCTRASTRHQIIK